MCGTKAYLAAAAAAAAAGRGGAEGGGPWLRVRGPDRASGQRGSTELLPFSVSRSAGLPPLSEAAFKAFTTACYDTPTRPHFRVLSKQNPLVMMDEELMRLAFSVFSLHVPKTVIKPCRGVTGGHVNNALY